MEVKRNQLETALSGKLGAIPDFSKHRNFKVYVEGRFVGKPSIGHSWRKLDQRLLRRVAAQIHLSEHELYDVVQCIKDGEWYREHLRSMDKL
ncbi:MAG: hypothetical protein R6U88_04415 [Candidatus Bipolaricaulota bacterium]